MLEGNIYFYRDRTGMARGPCNLSCMRKCWINDIIDEHTLTWCNGLSDFVPIRNVRGLVREIENPWVKLHKFVSRTINGRSERQIDAARAKHAAEGRSLSGVEDGAAVRKRWDASVSTGKTAAKNLRRKNVLKHGKENLDDVLDLRSKKLQHHVDFSWLKPHHDKDNTHDSTDSKK